MIYLEENHYVASMQYPNAIECILRSSTRKRILIKNTSQELLFETTTDTSQRPSPHTCTVHPEA